MEKTNEAFFADKGITSTSANHLANFAQELIEEDVAMLNGLNFVTITVDVIGSDAAPKLMEKGMGEEILEKIPEALDRISAMNAFCAWMREAVKAKDFELKRVRGMTVDSYCTEMGIEYPHYPSRLPSVTPEDVLADMNVKDRNEYYKLEAEASTLGKYVHNSKGSLNVAKNTLLKRMVTQCEKSGSGRDLIFYHFSFTVNPDNVKSLFNSLNNKYREVSARLNAIKANINAELEKRNLARSDEYSKELSAYEIKVRKLKEEARTWRDAEVSRISKLKIVIPKELQETYEFLNSLGKV